MKGLTVVCISCNTTTHTPATRPLQRANHPMSNTVNKPVAACQGVAARVERQTDFSAVEDALSDANTLASRVEALVECLLGSMPSAESDGTPSDSPSGVLPIMAQRASYTRDRIGHAMIALDCIEWALP